MPYRLLKHGKEHIGVINLDFKRDSIKHSAGLHTGTMVKKLNQKQKDYSTSRPAWIRSLEV